MDDWFPHHLQDVILELLTPIELATTSLTNHQLYALASSERHWKVLFERQFGPHYFQICDPVFSHFRGQFGIETTRRTLVVDQSMSSSDPSQARFATICEALDVASAIFQDKVGSGFSEPSSNHHAQCNANDCCVMDETPCPLSGGLPRVVILPGTYCEAIVVDTPVEIFGAGDRTRNVVLTNDVSSESSTLIRWKARYGSVRHLQLERANPSDQEERTKGLYACGADQDGHNQPSVDLHQVDISGFGSGVDLVNGSANITQCCIHHCSVAGVSLAMTNRALIEDNFIVHNTDGILVWKSSVVEDLDPILVRGNQIFDNNGSGIGVHSHSHALVESNFLFNSGQSGVYFSDHAKGKVRGNIIAQSGMAGVSIKSGAQPFVQGNAIVDGRSAGVYIRGGATGSIVDNLIIRNAKAGVGIKQHANPQVARNCIADGQAAAVCVHRTAGGAIQDNKFGTHAHDPLVWLGAGATPEVTKEGGDKLGVPQLRDFVRGMRLSTEDGSERSDVLAMLRGTYSHVEEVSLHHVPWSQGENYSHESRGKICESVDTLLLPGLTGMSLEDEE